MKHNSNKGYEHAKEKLDTNRAKQKAEAIAKWKYKNKKCGYCKATLTYAKRHNSYCTQSCARRSLAIVRFVEPKHSAFRPAFCTVCGKQRMKGTTQFCGHECHAKHQWNNKKQEILDNIENGKPVTHATLKKLVLEQRGNRCEICGISEYLNLPVLMIMDHINGNGHDNRLDNLRLVCPICDTRLPTYKSKNRGKGRPERRLHQQLVAKTWDAIDHD